MKYLGLSALLLIICSFNFPAKEIKLEYAFKVGDQYVMTQVGHQNIKQSVPGMGDLTVEVDVSSTMLTKVVELTPTGAKIEASYQSLKMNTKSPMGMADMSMDSEGSQESVQNKTMKALMNRTFSFTISKKGEVEKVEGTENLYADLGSTGLDEASMKAMKQQFQQSLGNDTQKAALAMTFIVFPDKKVAVGTSWKSAANGLAMNFATKIENTMTLKSADASKATVSIAGVITTTDKEKVVDLPNGMKSKLNVSGTQTLEANLNVKTGWSTDMTGASLIKGTMTLLAGGMLPTDMEVPVEINTKSEYKVTKK